MNRGRTAEAALRDTSHSPECVEVARCANLVLRGFSDVRRAGEGRASVGPVGRRQRWRRCPVKGDDSSGDPIYRLPGGQYYDVTVPEECVASEAAARAAGYGGSEL